MLTHALLDALLLRLGWTSLQALLLIAAIALATWLWPRMPATMRCALWWLVAAQVMLGLCWQAPLPLRVLPAAPVAQALTVTASTPVADAPAATMLAVTHAATGGAKTRMAAAKASWLPRWLPRWQTALAATWLGGILLQLWLAYRQWRDARHVWRASTPVTDAALQTLCQTQAEALGLRRAPQLRALPGISSPQVMGLWRPVILLPAAGTLDASETAMALAHELAHLRRGDLWLGWIPGLAQRLFFFHPWVKWAAREYALSREAACDAMVLAHAKVAAHDYGQLLLRLGVTRVPHACLAGASPSFRTLKRRLIMLQQPRTSPRHARAWLLALPLLALAVVPWRVTAKQTSATAHAAVPAHAASAAVAFAPAPPPPPPPPPGMVPLPPPAPSAALAPPPPPPAPDAPPAPPAPPPPPPPGSGFAAHHVDISTQSDARDGFVLFADDSVMIHGSDHDEAVAKRLAHSGDSLLWFRRGDKAWIIRDPHTLQQAKAVYAPLTTLAQTQGRLAGKQGELAGQQGALAGERAGFAARRAAMAQRRAMLASQQAQLAAQRVSSRAGDDRGQAARRADLDARQVALQREQAQMDRDVAKSEAALAERQHTLARRQAALAKQQQAQSRRQQQARKSAQVAMQKLLQAAIDQGLAQPAKAR